jgi:hypothetical protein
MTEANGGGRPRAKTMVGLDVYNAYARLGVSPLLSTDEIKEIINRKRKELMRRRRTRADQQFGEEDAEMTSLQAIEDEIGTPKARARYDRVNPQNLLLTVQAAPGDAGLDPGYRSGLVTAWLVEELGRESRIPSAEDLSLWAPHGLDPEIIEYLAGFARGDRAVAADRVDAAEVPEVAELGRFGLDLVAESHPRPAGKASMNVMPTGESKGGLPDV